MATASFLLTPTSLSMHCRELRLDRSMVRSLQVRSLHTEVRSLHSKVSSLHQISYFAPYISYFAPWRKLTWKVEKRQKDKGKEKKKYCNATKDSPFLTGVQPGVPLLYTTVDQCTAKFYHLIWLMLMMLANIFSTYKQEQWVKKSHFPCA